MVQHRYDIIGINFTERNELTIAILLVHSLPRNVIQLSRLQNKRAIYVAMNEKMASGAFAKVCFASGIFWLR